MDAVKTVIPFFLGLILVEWLLGGARLYRLNDSIADLGEGIVTQILEVPLFVMFSQLYRATALLHWSVHSVWTWITALLLVDFLYYWFHRSSHRISFVWATHIVHHQSEELNPSVLASRAVKHGVLLSAGH